MRSPSGTSIQRVASERAVGASARRAGGDTADRLRALPPSRRESAIPQLCPAPAHYARSPGTGRRELSTPGGLKIARRYGARFACQLTALATVLCLAGGWTAMSATPSTTFQSRIEIVAECTVRSTQTLNFGPRRNLDTVLDTSADIGVQCTSTTPYNIRLDAGSTAGGTIAVRLLDNGSATISHKMLRDAGRPYNRWQTKVPDTVPATGNGSVQTHTVYGRVSARVTPAPAIPTDTVTVTVEY